ncbi:hypothetical protein [Pseudonocardia sp. TRM90224]|uniref:hypothetical protein n=1 Tax=Pseudonocardia sp. TRM90224 TaxID=2812678 RepID=UPI001E5AF585|nr:hypothetical protein [Pseudonocardia sp. TRM90224]
MQSLVKKVADELLELVAPKTTAEAVVCWRESCGGGKEKVCCVHNGSPVSCTPCR